MRQSAEQLAPKLPRRWHSEQLPLTTTLLALVRAVSESADDDAEVVATVRHLLSSGQVRLCGSFRDLPPSVFD